MREDRRGLLEASLCAHEDAMRLIAPSHDASLMYLFALSFLSPHPPLLAYVRSTSCPSAFKTWLFNRFTQTGSSSSSSSAQANNSSSSSGSNPPLPNLTLPSTTSHKEAKPKSTRASANIPATKDSKKRLDIADSDEEMADPDRKGKNGRVKKQEDDSDDGSQSEEDEVFEVEAIKKHRMSSKTVSIAGHLSQTWLRARARAYGHRVKPTASMSTTHAHTSLPRRAAQDRVLHQVEGVQQGV